MAVPKGFWTSGAFLSALAWLLTYFGARAAAESPEKFSTAALVAIVLVPVAPAAAFLYFGLIELREMDELQRRIQLEALAVAFPLTLFMLMTLGLLQLVIDLNPADWSYRHVWHFMVIFYLMGITVSARRYR